MKRLSLLSVLALLSILLGLVSGPLGAQGQNSPAPGRVPAAPHNLSPGAVESFVNQPTWHIGPYPPPAFQYVRHDGVFVPGPDNAPWANRIYFLGGRTSPSTESPNIWAFDPVTGVYTDTQADVVEDVSNYNGNLILDDCTGRGPAIYVVGGTDKNGGGYNIGMVQVYYPELNLAEALVSADNWPGMINGSYTAAMGTAVVDDLIYAYGGWQTDSEPYFSAETWRFDPCAATGMRWANLGAPMAVAKSYIMSAEQNGKIYSIGGIDEYTNDGDLVPTADVEVLDTANLAAGWQPLAPMPVALAEGRAFGLSSDTLGPFSGYIYTAGGGDWPLPSPEAMRYDIANDSWDQSFPDLNDLRADTAGTYVPLYTPDPNDGLPGMWVFSGRVNESCQPPPPFARTEYYPLQTTEQCNVLLVDDDWDQYEGQPLTGGGGYYYTETLQSLGYSYDRWDAWTLGSPTLADLQDYDAVIWFTGYAWEDTVTATNEADLAAYLESGGNLLLSSEDYLFDRGLTPFGATYLGIDSFLTDTDEVDLMGTIGDPLGDGLGPYTLTTPASWPSGEPNIYTDEVTPTAGSSAPFYYVASGIAGSTDRDALNWRSAFLAWPIEGLADLNDREEVLGRTLDWFCYSRPSEVLLLPESQSGSGAAGTEITYTLSLVNNLSFADSFTIEYSATWPITGPVLVGPLDNGEIYDFVVTVTAAANCGEVDQALLTAASVSSPRYSDTATIQTTAEVPGLGDLAGTIYDLNTGLGIPNAHLYLLWGGSPYTETWADATGAYTVTGLPACFYEGGADAVRYYSTTLAVTLEPGVVTPLDLDLAASRPLLSDSAVSLTLPEGGAGAYTATLSNVGSGDLLFSLAETPTDTAWLTFGPAQGTIVPSDSLPIVLGLDTAGLALDACYTSSLYLQFNDPYLLEIRLPVQLCVERVEPPCQPPDSFDFSWLPFTPTVGDPVTLTAVVVGTPTLPLTLTWNFGDGGAPVAGTELVVTHLYTVGGTFTVTLRVQNPCSDETVGYTLTVEEKVVPPTVYRIYLPIVLKNH